MNELQSLTTSVSSFFIGESDILDRPESTLDYRALFEQTPKSLILFHTEGRVLAANSAYTDFWDITVHQIPADYNILHDPQLEARGVLPLVRRAFAGEIVQLPPMQYDVGSLVGGVVRVRWFLGVVYPVFDPAGHIRFMAMSHTDITLQMEQKLASDELARKEEHLLQQIISSSADGVVMLDLDWRFTYSNQEARDLIAGGARIAGLRLWETHPNLAESARDHFYKAMDQRVPFEFEHYYPEPIDRWYRVRVFPVEDGISIFFQNFTERRRAEKLLRENEKLAVAGRLAASIAHEINNPLESINNLLYLLETEESQSESSRTFISLAQQELRRIAHITVNTLQYFRPAAVSSVSSVQELTESVMAMFKGRIRQSGVNVETRFSGHPPLHCVPSEMRQILVNILGNALDATPADGRIFIRTRPQHHAGTNDAGILLTIADTGCGMSQATLDHLYEAFYTTKPTSGTGLGLWVSHDLIRKHRGQVRVRSREARYARGSRHGTVFQIFFPFNNGIIDLDQAAQQAISPSNFRHLPIRGTVTLTGDQPLELTPRLDCETQAAVGSSRHTS